MATSLFVTFEGPEGGGKSTALGVIAERMRAAGLEVVTTREPGSGVLGAGIRELLLHGEAIDPKSELLLFLADRANHVSTVIRPALERGAVVLCDRFIDSTVVYQGFGRGLDLEFLQAANRFAAGSTLPELTLLFDLPAEVGLARIKSKDRLDSMPMEFHRTVRQGFLSLAGQDQSRWRILDATNAPEVVADTAFDHIFSALSAKS